jgi:serine/threonine protein kinase
MEYLQGETLEDLLKRKGKLPPEEACRVVHQALRGLQQIFEEGLVHRDMKPANLMLVPAPNRGGDEAVVKILDIGMGRDLFSEGEGGPGIQLTTSKDTLGTAEYMSPEQARDPHAVDIRSDIYSLGCTLYHALTGAPPFVEVNHVRLVVRHATEAPRPVNEVDPVIPAGLQQILNWMLAKDPTQRYPTPARAASALEVYLASRGPLEDTLDADPQMRAYLAMINKQQETNSAAPPPIPSPAAPPGKPASGPSRLPPKQAQAADSNPNKAGKPGKPAGRVDVELVEAIPGGEEEAGWKPLFVAAGMGAGVVALLALVVYLVYLIFR